MTNAVTSILVGFIASAIFWMGYGFGRLAERLKK